MKEPDLEHFQSIPWCSELIKNPTFTITPTFSRIPKPHDEDSLIASTLKSPAAISSCLSLYLIPPPSSPWISEVRSLMTLGSGMNGGPNMLHGGIIATLMDDVIGTLLTVNKDQEGSPLTDHTVTAELNVKYLRPVRTPQTVLVVARCREVLREGTRFVMDAEVRDEKGKVLAKADSVWTAVRRRPEQKL